MADQQYTTQQVQAALEAGLISEEDAQLLLQGLEPGIGMGDVVGGAAGLAAGGILGSALGQKAGNVAKDWAGDAAGAMKNFARGAGEPIASLGGSNRADVAGMTAGGLGGMAGGAALGDTIYPADPGEGIGGGAELNQETGEMDMDRDYMLRALVDPSVPPQVKRQIMEALQAYDQESPPAEMGYGEGAPWGAMMGGAAGMGAGGALGAKYAGDMGQFMQPGAEADMAGLFNKGRKGLGDALSGSRGKWGAGIAGGLAGAGLGALAGGMISPARPSPYQDPLQ